MNTEESVVVVEDFGSSQGESVIHVAGDDERELSPNRRDVSVEKLERSEEESRLAHTESFRNKMVCVATDAVWRTSAPCGDVNDDGDDLAMPG